VASRSLGIARPTLYKWIKMHNLDTSLREGREQMLDLAENKLATKINDGDTTALIFFLKTQGKSRGYVEKQEIDHTITPPTAVNIISVAANQIADDIDG